MTGKILQQYLIYKQANFQLIDDIIFLGAETIVYDELIYQILVDNFMINKNGQAEYIRGPNLPQLTMITNLSTEFKNSQLKQVQLNLGKDENKNEGNSSSSKSKALSEDNIIHEACKRLGLKIKAQTSDLTLYIRDHRYKTQIIVPPPNEYATPYQSIQNEQQSLNYQDFLPRLHMRFAMKSYLDDYLEPKIVLLQQQNMFNQDYFRHLIDTHKYLVAPISDKEIATNSEVAKDYFQKDQYLYPHTTRQVGNVKEYKFQCFFLEMYLKIKLIHKEDNQGCWYVKKNDAKNYAALQIVKILSQINIIDENFLLNSKLIKLELPQNQMIQVKKQPEKSIKIEIKIEDYKLVQAKQIKQTYQDIYILLSSLKSLQCLIHEKPGNDYIEPNKIGITLMFGNKVQDDNKQLITNFINSSQDKQVKLVDLQINEDFLRYYNEIVAFHLYSIYIMNSSLYELYYKILDDKYYGLFESQQDQKQLKYNNLFDNEIKLIQKSNISKQNFKDIYSFRQNNKENPINQSNIVDNTDFNDQTYMMHNLILPLTLNQKQKRYILDNFLLIRTVNAMRSDLLQILQVKKIQNELQIESQINKNKNQHFAQYNPFLPGQVQLLWQNTALSKVTLCNKFLYLLTQDSENVLRKNDPKHWKSIQDFYFITQGVLLKYKNNERIAKCRKIKNLLDYTEIIYSSETDNQAKSIQQILPGNQQDINTIQEEKQLEQKIKNYQNKPYCQMPLEVDSLSSLQSLEIINQGQQRQELLLDVSTQSLQQLPFTLQQYHELQKINYLQSIVTSSVRHSKFINDFIIQRLLQKEVNNQQQKQQSQSQQQKQIDFQASIDNSVVLSTTKNFIDDDIFFDDFDEEEKSNQFNEKLYTQEMLSMHYEEALTSPQVDKHNNYERLEFFGDSVLNFLALLELCTTLPNLKNREIDVLKVERINNRNLAQAAEMVQLNMYMASGSNIQQNTILPDFINKEINEKVLSRKNIQQLVGKLVYLNQQKYSLIQQQKEESQIQHVVTDEFITMMRCIQDRKDMFTYLQDYLNKNYQNIEQKSTINKMHPARQNATQLFEKYKITQTDLELIFIDYNINKIQSKYFNLLNKKIEQKDQGKQNQQQQPSTQQQQVSLPTSQNKQQIKQLADVVEALTGLISLKNVQYASIFLKNIGILKYDLQQMQEFKQNQLLKIADPKINAATNEFYAKMFKSLILLEKGLGDIYNFKDQKLAYMSLINSSYFETTEFWNSYGHIEKTIIQSTLVSDNERLEFLGDSILNYFVSEYIYNKTQPNKEQYPPKKIHIMKQNVISNVMLTHIVVELGLDQLLMYDKNSFKQQQQQSTSSKDSKTIEDNINIIRQKIQEFPISVCIERYNNLQEILRTKETQKNNVIIQQELQTLYDKDLASLREDIQSVHDAIYENNYKMFSDMFEAIIGAIYLDCRDLNQTKQVLMFVMKDYLTIFTDFNMILDNPRTATLELWDSKPYTKELKLYHTSAQGQEHTMIAGMIGELEVIRVKLKNVQKNKIRDFYKAFFKFISGLLEVCDKENVNNKDELIKIVRKYRIGWKA